MHANGGRWLAIGILPVVLFSVGISLIAPAATIEETAAKFDANPWMITLSEDFPET